MRTLRRTIGVYAAGETGLEILPKSYRRDGSKPGVLLLHGNAEDETQAFGSNPLTNNQGKIAQTLADEGYPCFAPLAAGNAAANDTALARVTDAYNYLTGPLGAKAGKVFVLGLSMGGGTAMAWARANITKVAALVLLEPMSDLNDIVVNDRAGTATVVNSAYGGAYDDTVHGPTHSPVRFANQLASIPAHVWYATGDTTVVPSTVQAVIAAAGWTDVHTVPGNHGSSMYNQVDVSGIVSFLKSISTSPPPPPPANTYGQATYDSSVYG